LKFQAKGDLNQPKLWDPFKNLKYGSRIQTSCDTPGLTVQGTMQLHCSYNANPSANFKFKFQISKFLNLGPFATGKGSSKFLIQVMSSKFIFLNIMPRYNYDEFLGFFQKV
jgi:hypothetical protein